jgi:hypothetical protein
MSSKSSVNMVLVKDKHDVCQLKVIDAIKSYTFIAYKHVTMKFEFKENYKNNND